MTEQNEDKFEEATGDDRDDNDPSKNSFSKSIAVKRRVKSKRKKKSSLKVMETIETLLPDENRKCTCMYSSPRLP